MKKLPCKTLLLLLAALSFSYSCGSDDDDTPNIIIVDPESGSSETSSDPSVYASRMEVPKLAESDGIFVAHEATYGKSKVMNYCLEFAPSAMHSRWVAFRFDAITRPHPVGRSDEPFCDDPLLPTDYWIGSSYFNGYNRGHICASADRLWSVEANEETFYMSNMSPQIGNFNSGIWATFENRFRDKARDATFSDTVYVAKGGTIADGQYIHYVVRPNNKLVRVPKYYFMAFMRHRYGSYDAIGLWLEHRNYDDSEYTYANLSGYLVSINDLEAKTGIDFFPNLPDNMEDKVESTFNPTLWGFK